MKKILILNWGRRSASTLIAYQFIKALKKKFDVHHSISIQSDFFAETQKINFKYFNVSTYKNIISFPFKTILFYFFRYRIINYIKKNNINYVIYPMFHVWNALIIKKLKKCNITNILCVHDSKLHPGEFSIYVHFALKYSIRQTDYAIAFSNEINNQLIKFENFSSNKIFKIDLPSFTSIEKIGNIKKLNNQFMRVLFFGRIVDYKGLDIFLEAVIKIQNKINIEATIAGKGNINNYKKLISKVKNIKIMNHWLSEKEIINLFDKTNLCILPYVESSQSGIVPYAFMTATPILASNVGGLKEQISNYSNGIIAEPNSEEFSKCIVNLYQKKKLYFLLSKGAISTFKEKYSFLNFEKNLSQIISKIK